jgi:hypothetical protein
MAEVQNDINQKNIFMIREGITYKAEHRLDFIFIFITGYRDPP